MSAVWQAGQSLTSAVAAIWAWHLGQNCSGIVAFLAAFKDKGNDRPAFVSPIHAGGASGMDGAHRDL